MTSHNKARIVGQVERVQHVTDDLQIVWVRTQDSLQNYKPGRFSVMQVKDSHNRAYSIVSLTEGGKLIELFVELIPEAKRTARSLTPKLWQCAAGDLVTVIQQAQGDFILKDEAYHLYNHIMVATVTGIAPFMAMLRDRLVNPNDPNRFFVLFGASYCDELAYHQELLDMAGRYSDRMAYIVTVSQPQKERNASWRHDADNGFEVGRVNVVLEKFLHPDGTTLFGPTVNNKTAILYACGNGGMIESVRQMYASKEMEESRRWIFVDEAF